MSTTEERLIELVKEIQIEKVFLVGDFAKGLDSPIIDLIFIGNIDKNYLISLVEKAEEMVKRKIRYLIYDNMEFELHSTKGFANEALLLWSNDDVLTP